MAEHRVEQQRVEKPYNNTCTVQVYSKVKQKREQIRE